MKLLFSFVLFVFVLFPSLVWSENYIATYSIKTNGFLIGKLDWDLKKSEDSYLLKIELKSKGLLSSLFSFKGSYGVSGIIKNGKFISSQYYQSWKTNKKTRDVQINFQSDYVKTLIQLPEEKESLRIDLASLQGYSDPLTSFLKLLNGLEESKTIDGRRAYTLKHIEEKNGQNKYVIKNFLNLWADHKRNSLEYISFEAGESKLIPKSIFINFKGRLFKVLIE